MNSLEDKPDRSKPKLGVRPFVEGSEVKPSANDVKEARRFLKKLQPVEQAALRVAFAVIDRRTGTPQ
jgi:hypothetical protein